ncbi:MAG: chemotaxis protein CheW [Mycobacteriales bacterium]|nr:chemotaxis protein CheW [Mycobacteriales bacterium]
MSDERQYCTFYAGDLYFGIWVREVQEVLLYQDMVRVPLASPVIRGLINLRGQIVTAIDLRRRLDLPDREDGVDPMNVVVRTDDGAVSLLVDQIGDVVEVDDRTFENAPENLGGPARDLIEGVYKLEGHLLLVLDPAKTIDVPSPRRADT